MRRAALVTGCLVLALAWWVAGAGHSMVAHMTAHMAAVAIAAPLVGFGLAGTPADPATRWPRVVAPLPMMLLELAVVWGWHLPAARKVASASAAGLVAEQAMFFAAGLLLWSACIGSGHAGSETRRAVAVIALLLTTMHMTLLGVLITLAPRLLYGTSPEAALGLTPMADQQLGGVIMLVVGGGSYLLGGTALLAGLLRGDRPRTSQLWS